MGLKGDGRSLDSSSCRVWDSIRTRPFLLGRTCPTPFGFRPAL